MDATLRGCSTATAMMNVRVALQADVGWWLHSNHASRSLTLTHVFLAWYSFTASTLHHMDDHVDREALTRGRLQPKPSQSAPSIEENTSEQFSLGAWPSPSNFLLCYRLTGDEGQLRPRNLDCW